MAMGLDDLNNDLQQEAGATPPTANAAATPPTATAQDTLLDGKPHELQVKIMKAVTARKLDQDDPILEVYNCTGMAAEAATAAGDAARAVRAGVSQIPDQIWTGAVKASDEVKGGLVAGGKIFTEAFTKAAADRQKALEGLVDTRQQAILTAADLGAERIRQAASGLTSSLDKAVDAKKGEGVSEFAKAAATAATAAAQASLIAQISRSAVASVLAFTFASLVGAGGLWGWLLITHRVAPAGVVAMADPLGGGDLLIVPNGGKVVPPSQCPAGICLVYRPGSIPLIP